MDTRKKRGSDSAEEEWRQKVFALKVNEDVTGDGEAGKGKAGFCTRMKAKGESSVGLC